MRWQLAQQMQLGAEQPKLLLALYKGERPVAQDEEAAGEGEGGGEEVVLQLPGLGDAVPAPTERLGSCTAPSHQTSPARLPPHLQNRLPLARPQPVQFAAVPGCPSSILNILCIS